MCVYGAKNNDQGIVGYTALLLRKRLLIYTQRMRFHRGLQFLEEPVQLYAINPVPGYMISGYTVEMQGKALIVVMVVDVRRCAEYLTSPKNNASKKHPQAYLRSWLGQIWILFATMGKKSKNENTTDLGGSRCI